MMKITPRSVMPFWGDGIYVLTVTERGSKNEKDKTVGGLGVMPMPFVRNADLGRIIGSPLIAAGVPGQEIDPAAHQLVGESLRIERRPHAGDRDRRVKVVKKRVSEIGPHNGTPTSARV